MGRMLRHRTPKILIPCQKLYQAEKVNLNKQMPPTRNEIMIMSHDPTSKCPHQESRSFWGAPYPSTNIHKYAVVLLTTKLIQKHLCLIDVISDTSDIELQFEELPCMHS